MATKEKNIWILLIFILSILSIMPFVTSLKTGTKDETSVELAQRILKLNDTDTEDLSYLQALSIEELMQIKGIGKVKAIQLKAVTEIAIRMFKTSNYKAITIKQPHDLAKILMSELKFEKSEKVKIIVLNNKKHIPVLKQINSTFVMSKNGIIYLREKNSYILQKNEIQKIKDIATGGSNFANVSIKDILSEPIKMKAPKIIVVHNHPSGDSTPSKQDIVFTEQLYEISELMGIQLLDHLVIGNMNYTSIFSKMFS